MGELRRLSEMVVFAKVAARAGVAVVDVKGIAREGDLDAWQTRLRRKGVGARVVRALLYQRRWTDARRVWGPWWVGLG